MPEQDELQVRRDADADLTRSTPRRSQRRSDGASFETALPREREVMSDRHSPLPRPACLQHRSAAAESPTSTAGDAYGEGSHPDPRRPGGGAQAPRHVHRRHVRRHRPAPPGVRGGRQLDRRGAGRLLRRHRRHHPHRQLDLGHRQRPRHPDRRQDGRQARAEALGRRDRADRAARRRQVQPEQLQGLGRPARRRRVAASTRFEVAAPDGPPRRQGRTTWSSASGVRAGPRRSRCATASRSRR